MEEKIKRDVIKLIAFITLVNLPFISLTQILGSDIFFDSFENPNSYHYFKNNIIDTIPDKYFVLQKSSHPDFSMSAGDKIIYLAEDGNILCNSIMSIKSKNSDHNLYSIYFPGESEEEQISEYEIIGKIINNIDDNIWNKISLKLWDASINSLNAVALFTKN